MRERERGERLTDWKKRDERVRGESDTPFFSN